MAILLIDAGGTITSRAGADGALVGCPADEAGCLPGEIAGVEVVVERVYSGLSENMGFADLTRLARAVLAGQVRGGIDAIVVAHGTDIMEESAYFCDLVIDARKPVIFTGAQRAPGARDFDGLANLRDAIAVAGHKGTGRLGVLIVFGGRIIPAVQAYKCHTSNLVGFSSHGTNVGWVTADHVKLPCAVSRPEPLPLYEPEDTVTLVKLRAAMSTRELSSLLSSGYRAVVVEGLGSGNAPDALCDLLVELHGKGVIVAIGTRCAGGGASVTYESGKRLAEAGIMTCAHLPAVQARILLALLLSQPCVSPDLIDAFSEHVRALSEEAAS